MKQAQTSTVVSAVALVLGFRYINPAPPDAIDLSAGAEEGAEHAAETRHGELREQRADSLSTGSARLVELARALASAGPALAPAWPLPRNTFLRM